ncbi:MAG: TIM-barrel domain-containing protein, partial [Sphaerochaetaceae bacterium]
MMGFLDGMQARHIPVSVFHFDCFWMRAFHWCDFLFDPAMFPDPAGLIARIHQRGIKVCMWINPYIAQRSVLFAEGKEKGYLVTKPNGDVWQTDLWQPGMALVDFTNDDACRWYQDKLSVLLDLGVDAFKTDFGERIPKHVVYHDGSDPNRMHNY